MRLVISHRTYEAIRQTNSFNSADWQFSTKKTLFVPSFFSSLFDYQSFKIRIFLDQSRECETINSSNIQRNIAFYDDNEQE